MTTVRAWRGTVDRWLDGREPHQVQGPFTRWPRASDAALAIIAFGLSLVTVAVSGLDDGEQLTPGSVVDHPAGAIALLALAAGALWWRRARAHEVTLAIMVITIVWAALGFGDGHDVASVVAGYSLGRHVADPRRSAALTSALAVVNVAGTIIDSSQRVDILPAIILAFGPWYVGRRVRNRGDYVALLTERAERLEAERQAAVERAEAEERARIARELHDVVAHQVSMMTVQAGAAKTVARHDLDVAIEAMADVERAGRATLAELRHLLGVLRPTVEDAATLDPQPGLADVPALLDDMRSTGAEVTFSRSGDNPGLTAATELAIYRIVQEAATNIVKHAGPKPTVEIAIDFGGSDITVEVANTMARAADTLPGAGFGLTGMRERVSLLGGDIEAGPVDAERFLVRARLPITEPR